MRKLKVAIYCTIVAALVLATYLVSLQIFFGSDTIELAFDTYAEADSSENDSWIPDLMPKSATNIHVRYSASPGFVQLEFNLDPSDGHQILRDFVAVSDPSEKYRIRTQFDSYEWKLSIDAESSLYSLAEFDGAVYQEMHLCVSKDGDTAWFIADN